MKGLIPIRDAKRISEERQCPVIIIFGLDKTTQRIQLTTYGETKALCRYAAELSDKISRQINDGTIAPSLVCPTHYPAEPTEKHYPPTLLEAAAEVVRTYDACLAAGKGITLRGECIDALREVMKS